MDEWFWNTSFVSGIEGIPWAGRHRLEGDLFRLERSIDESGKLSMVWPTLEYGPMTLSTASLRCVDEDYLLPLELARGTLTRIRGRAFDWQRQGLKLSDDFCNYADRGLSAFLDAILAKHDAAKCAELSQLAIEMTLAAGRPLAASFIQQSLAFRQRQESRLGALLGVKLSTTSDWRDSSNALLPGINLAAIGLEWGTIEADSGRAEYELFDQQIEWAQRHQLRVCGGPLVSLQPHAMPHWLYLLDHFDTLLEAACEFTRKTVLRYKGKVHLWTAATGLNCPNSLGLSDEQLLRLAVGVIQTIRRTDDRTPVVLCLDMPWAEYLGQSEKAVSPLHFADALIRADLGLSGLGLEFNMNYWPHGTLPRDLIDLGDLIDHWAMLGLPLMATVNVPDNTRPDPKANSKAGLVTQWKHPPIPPELGSKSATGLPPSEIEMIELFLAKPNVHGIIWSQATDLAPHYFPNAGLFDSNGAPRASLNSLIQLRQKYLD